jgi:hypothetical protein
MPIKVSEATLKLTTRCPHDFVCLIEGKCPFCEPTRLIRGDGVLVASDELKPCPYMMPYRPWQFTMLRCVNSLYICSCPTRHEIYERYGV